MKKVNPFAKDYSPYGTYEGRAGSPDAWRAAFQQRFSPEEVKELLGTDTAWAILGLEAGSSEAQIKQAYRKRAKATHPDLHPGIDRIHFQRVLAAYQELMR